jgi:carbon-monoxide dehydrogenase medium subunit
VDGAVLSAGRPDGHVKLPACALATPRSVEEAVAYRAEFADDAAVLAGGQSLVPLMALRLATPAVLVDLRHVAGLDHIAVTGDGGVVVGAMARQRVVERHPEVTKRTPLLTNAIANIGHIAIRNQGTVGGSIAHADPAAELPAVALAADVTMVLAGPRGRREVPATDFFAGYLTTTIAPDELLEEVRFPGQAPGTGVAFEEFSRRHGDFALVGVAAVLRIDGSGRIGDARLALAAVGPTPVRAHAAEVTLLGAAPSDEVFEAAGAAASAAVDPIGDLHGTAAYRRHLVGVLVRKALTVAARRAHADPGEP